MYCHTTGIVFWLLFPLNSSRVLHKIFQKCSCFLSLLYAVFQWSYKWSCQSNTICVNSSLHINTINQFQIRIKTRFTTKNSRRADLSPVFAMSPLQNVSFIKPKCFLWYWVDCLSLKTNNCSFWKLNNHFWRCNSVFTTMTPRYL